MMSSALFQPVHMLENLSKAKNFASVGALYVLVLRLKPGMTVPENMVLEKS
jgi:hypothetical protein